MSDSDSFINEVSEEVRRDRYFSLWKKYGPFLIGGVIAIVVAAAVVTYLDQRARAAAQAAGGALIEASQGDLEAQIAALTELADATDHDGEALVARLRVAAALATDGDAEGAAAIYDRIASDDAADALLQDFAAFRAVALRGEGMPPAAYADALSPIANGNGAYRLLAIEARGIALFRAGDETGARDELRAVYNDERAPQSLTRRVEILAQAMGLELAE